jgi:hypothetical protein
MGPVAQVGGVTFILLTAGFTQALARPIARVSNFKALDNQNLLANQLRESTRRIARAGPPPINAARQRRSCCSASTHVSRHYFFEPARVGFGKNEFVISPVFGQKPLEILNFDWMNRKGEQSLSAHSGLPNFAPCP